MSAGRARIAVELRAALHELLDVVLDRAVAPLSGGLYASFAPAQLEEGGVAVPNVPAVPLGIAVAIGKISADQLTVGLEAVAAVAAAAGETVRSTRRSKGAPDDVAP